MKYFADTNTEVEIAFKTSWLPLLVVNYITNKNWVPIMTYKNVAF